jgi:hypothetical protein
VAFEEPNLVAEPLASLGFQPGLADPGLTADGDDGAPWVSQFLQHLKQRRQLLLAPDQRAKSGLRCFRALARDPERRDRGALPLQLDFAQRLELEAVLELAGSLGADDHVAELLQPGGHVDGVAESVVELVRRQL